MALNAIQRKLASAKLGCLFGFLGVNPLFSGSVQNNVCREVNLTHFRGEMLRGIKWDACPGVANSGAHERVWGTL